MSSSDEIPVQQTRAPSPRGGLLGPRDGSGTPTGAPGGRRHMLTGGRWLSSRPTLVLMWCVTATYIGALLVFGSGAGTFDLAVDGVLCQLATTIPALVCLASARRPGPRRVERVLLGLGMTGFAIGYVIFLLGATGSEPPPFPSWADAAFLSFYPLALGATVVAGRRELSGHTRGVRIDGLLAALGVGSLMVLIVGPALLAHPGGLATSIVAAAYPTGDLVVVAALFAILGLRDRPPSATWALLIAGTLCFATADILYARRVADGSYTLGTPMDCLWAVALACLATWALRGEDRAPAAARPTVGTATVPLLATVTALAVLAAHTTPLQVPVLATVLALMATAAASLRSQHAIRQLRGVPELRRQALTDELTGLPNRRAFYEAATAVLSGPHRPRALLLLDLDKFKDVNDGLGHHVGDALLVQAGKRIRSAVGSEGVLGRLGGDEFAVLLHHCTEARAKVIAQAVTTSLARPFTLGEHEVQSAASLGIALAPDHGQELPTLLRHADVAMYRAKADHLEIVVYDTHQDRNGTHRLHDLQDLRDALDLDQFVLHFQPKIDLIKEQVCGVEALVRWDHPRDGLTYPDAFLPLVEDSGLMRALTRKVLNDAFRQAATWRRGGRPLVVAVNLSASSLLDRDLPDQVQRMLEHHRLPGTAVQLEITEGFLLTDPDQATAVLQRLRRQGIGISLDDFGTGYSSLSYLRNLPLDELKLDRSFVSQMADDGRASALVAATIGLAHSLGLRLVAEGVEDSTTYSELRRLGCDQAQGYHLGRPMPAAELERWLDTPHAFARARGDLAR